MADSFVAFRLSPPYVNLADAEIALDDVVRRAYSESQGTAAAAFAVAYAKNADDIIKMYATFIVECVPVYGVKRSTAVLERISLRESGTEFHVHDGALVLKNGSGSVYYRELRISSGDYNIVLNRLRSGW